MQFNGNLMAIFHSFPWLGNIPLFSLSIHLSIGFFHALPTINGAAQFSSIAQSCLTLCNLMNCSMPGFPVHHQLPELVWTQSIELAMPSNHLICCHLFLLLPSIFPSIRVFSNNSVLCIRCPKYWSFSFSISPSSEDSGLISFRTGWIPLKSKGLSRAFFNTIVQKHQFFGAQLSLWSNSHIHTWPLEKNIALTRWTFVGKVMSLLFNMLSRLVITFLPRSKRLLIQDCSHHLQWFWNPPK